MHIYTHLHPPKSVSMPQLTAPTFTPASASMSFFARDITLCLSCGCMCGWCECVSVGVCVCDGVAGYWCVIVDCVE